MKPAKELTGQRDRRINKEKARAAREKIAADLAYDLGLPVPPVVLYKREEDGLISSKHVSVSLVMYPRQWAWGQVKHEFSAVGSGSPTGAAVAKTLASTSKMHVFDTWIGQTDHGYSPHNIVWGYEQGALEKSKLIFLDFANSLGSKGGRDFSNCWGNDGWQQFTKAQFPDLMVSHYDETLIDETIEEIKNLSKDNITEVVERIPPDFLLPKQACSIIDGLLGRREQLRSTFADPSTN